MGWEPVKCLIPQHLHRLNKSQRWLADKVEMTEQQVSNYVNMVRVMKLSTAKKFSVILGCSIDDLYKWKNERN